VSKLKELRRGVPAWHRVVYALAAAVLLFFTLWGWEHGAYMTFGVGALICVGLALRPSRLGAAVLFWPFAAGACFYAALLVKDLVVLAQGGQPEVLLDADDSVAFLTIEFLLVVVSVLSFLMWRPIVGRKPR
jgi:hypothetical protein